MFTCEHYNYNTNCILLENPLLLLFNNVMRTKGRLNSRKIKFELFLELINVSTFNNVQVRVLDVIFQY